MGKESVVDISGHRYRYEYDEASQKTHYLGPVGDAPAMSEEEFLAMTKDVKDAQKVLLNKFIEYGLACIHEFSTDFHKDSKQLHQEALALASALSVEFSGKQVERLLEDLERMSEYEDEYGQ